MNKVFENISGALSGQLGTVVLYSGIVGIMLTDALPNPGHVLAAYQEESLKKRLGDGIITDSEYRKKSINALSLYPPAWWALVLMTTFLYKGDLAAKAKLAGVMIAAGTMAGYAMGGNKPIEIKAKKEPLAFTGDSKPVRKPKDAIKRAVMRGNKIRIID